MACYIDDLAKDIDGDTHSGSEELFSEGHSDDDVVPLQNKRKYTKLATLESSSESESEQRRNNKENMGHSSSTTPKVPGSRKRKRDKSPCTGLILSELKKTNQFMESLSKKMKRHQARLEAIESKLQESTMSSSSSNATPKRSVRKQVPCEVRVSKSTRDAKTM